MLTQPHAIARNLKRCSRIVTLPDYQGVGIGTALLKWVAEYYVDKGYRFTIVTTTPALINSFQRSANWHLYRQGRVQAPGRTSGIINKNSDNSRNRMTTGWEYKREIV